MAKGLTHPKLFREAKKYLVGGVNSPVRSFRAVGGYPLFIQRAKGSKIYSEDKKEFIDYCQSFGALILGHAHPKVVEAVKKAVEKGSTFGVPTKQETELARMIIYALPAIEKIRFTNSGTEAVMAAVRLARAYTGKNKIIKFQGAYHGHADYLLDCPGVPEDFVTYTLICPYNNIQRVEELIKVHQKDLAALIVEPVAANTGVVLPKDNFLQELRQLTHRYKIVLIFDEVITGFRLAFGGAQELFRVKPDLTCLGKIIGGGLPVGALGGKNEMMRLLAPEGPVYQAGTFSGNPLTVAAGLTTLKLLSQSNPYSGLAELTRELCENIGSASESYGIKMEINFIGSIFSLFFRGLFQKFYHRLLKEGIYFSPSGLEANFISLAHTRKDIGITLKAVEKVFRNLKGD